MTIHSSGARRRTSHHGSPNDSENTRITMTDTNSKSEFLERLRDVHDFPGPFMFKVIGTNSDVFVAQVVQAVINVLGNVEPQVKTRESSAGNHMAGTVVVPVQKAEAVLVI